LQQNEIADRYGATKNLRNLLGKAVRSKNNIYSGSDHPLAEYYRRVKELNNSLGDAQEEVTGFRMQDYTKRHGSLPTVKTASVGKDDRESFENVGEYISSNLQLPADSSGNPLPIFVDSISEVEGCMETLSKYRNHLPGEDNESVKILHVADTHIGYSRRYKWKEGVDYSDQVDCLSAFKDVGRIAIREEVDAVVHAGDVFDDGVGGDQIEEFKQVVRRLNEADISFHFVVGNHDQRTVGEDGENAVAELMSMHKEGKINLLSNEPSTLGNGIVSLYGVGYMGLGEKRWEGNGWSSWDTSWWENPDLSFGRQPGTTHNILCTHGKFEVGGSHGELNRDGEEMTAKKVADESDIEFSKLLLGDKHSPKDGVGGNEDAHYSGPTKRIGSDDDFSPKINIFEFHASGEVELNREPISTAG
jgi:hypothetical protein